MKKITIFTDGGAKGNPGPAAIGVYMKSGLTDLLRYREDIGVATNNVAEYTAVIRALEKLIEMKSAHPDLESLEFFADSLLVVEQLKGKWKIKDPHLKDLIIIIHENLAKLGLPFTFTHIPREKNTVADNLVNGKL